jgi:hypothetical protein
MKRSWSHPVIFPGMTSISGGVFVLKDATTLAEMKPATFAAEDQFRRLLTDFPSLLAGVQIDPVKPQK